MAFVDPGKPTKEPFSTRIPAALSPTTSESTRESEVLKPTTSKSSRESEEIHSTTSKSSRESEVPTPVTIRVLGNQKCLTLQQQEY